MQFFDIGQFGSSQWGFGACKASANGGDQAYAEAVVVEARKAHIVVPVVKAVYVLVHVAQRAAKQNQHPGYLAEQHEQGKCGKRTINGIVRGEPHLRMYITYLQ